MSFKISTRSSFVSNKESLSHREKIAECRSLRDGIGKIRASSATVSQKMATVWPATRLASFVRHDFFDVAIRMTRRWHRFCSFLSGTILNANQVGTAHSDQSPRASSSRWRSWVAPNRTIALLFGRKGCHLVKNLYTALLVASVLFLSAVGNVACTSPSNPAAPGAPAAHADDAKIPEDELPVTPAADDPTQPDIKSVLPDAGQPMTTLGEQSDEKLLPADHGQGESEQRLVVDFTTPFEIPSAKLNGIKEGMDNEKNGRFTYQNGLPVDLASISDKRVTQIYCEIDIDPLAVAPRSASGRLGDAGGFVNIRLSGPSLVDDVYYETSEELTMGVASSRLITNQATIRFAPLHGEPKPTSLFAIRVVKILAGDDTEKLSGTITVKTLKSCFPKDILKVELVSDKKSGGAKK
jgi:hypothetical protein